MRCLRIFISQSFPWIWRNSTLTLSSPCSLTVVSASRSRALSGFSRSRMYFVTGSFPLAVLKNSRRIPIRNSDGMRGSYLVHGGHSITHNIYPNGYYFKRDADLGAWHLGSLAPGFQRAPKPRCLAPGFRCLGPADASLVTARDGADRGQARAAVRVQNLGAWHLGSLGSLPWVPRARPVEPLAVTCHWRSCRRSR